MNNESAFDLRAFFNVAVEIEWASQSFLNKVRNGTDLDEDLSAYEERFHELATRLVEAGDKARAFNHDNAVVDANIREMAERTIEIGLDALKTLANAKEPGDFGGIALCALVLGNIRSSMYATWGIDVQKLTAYQDLETQASLSS